ncbi:hypothetical protein PROFUN_16813, partial [Planoprotostelium fungivorum]
MRTMCLCKLSSGLRIKLRRSSIDIDKIIDDRGTDLTCVLRSVRHSSYPRYFIQLSVNLVVLSYALREWDSVNAIQAASFFVQPQHEQPLLVVLHTHTNSLYQSFFRLYLAFHIYNSLKASLRPHHSRVIIHRIDGERQDNVCAPLPHQTTAVSSSLFSLTSQRDRRKTVELLSLLWRARDRGRYRETHQQLSLFCAGASASARRLYRAGGTAQSQASDVCSDLSGCLFLYGEEQREE